MIKVYFLLLIVGSGTNSPTQSSIPVFDMDQCVAAGEKVKVESKKSIEYHCIEGVMK